MHWKALKKIKIAHYATTENNNELQNIYSFKYYDNDKKHNIKIPNKNKSLCI